MWFYKGVRTSEGVRTMFVATDAIVRQSKKQAACNQSPSDDFSIVFTSIKQLAFFKWPLSIFLGEVCLLGVEL